MVWCKQPVPQPVPASKTKEVVMDFRRNSGDHPPLTINSPTEERVSSTKFLGVHIKETSPGPPTPADSEHSCKVHLCPSLLHPGHFPCTMLQYSYQYREGPHPSLPQSLPAPTIRKTVPEHQSPLRQTAQQLFPPGCESPELKSPRPSLKPHTNPLPPETWTITPPNSTHLPTLPHHRKKLFFNVIQSVLHTGEWAYTNHL